MSSQKEASPKYNTRQKASTSWGRNVVRGDDNEERRAQIKNILNEINIPLPKDDPEKTILEVMSRFEKVCNLINEVGEPYLRAGTKDVNAQRVWAWNRIAGTVKAKAQLSLRVVKKTKNMEDQKKDDEKTKNAEDEKKGNSQEDQKKQDGNSHYITSWVHVDQFIAWMVEDNISRAKTLLALCWGAEDVTINEVFEFVQPVIMSKGYSGGEGLNKIEQPPTEY